MMPRLSEFVGPRRTIALSGLAVVAFIVWASLAGIDQVSRAGGQVIPAGRLQIVQSADGGVIGAINVREGDRVRKGQVLVTLDRVKIAAAVDEGQARVAALKAVKARIEAELFDRTLTFPAEISSYTDFITNQRDLFTKRRTAQAADMAAMRQMLGQVQQELAMNRPLLAYGDVSRSEVLRLERSVTDIEGQIANRRNKYLQDLQTEYAKVEEDLVTAEQTLTQRQASLAETELTAPTDGIVKNIRLTTIGGVLRPGDEVLEIVPTGDELIVEAKVAPADIAHLHIGQRASVKFDAYDSSIYGSADGKVTYVSPDTLAETRPGMPEQVYYRVHIKVSTATMRTVDRPIEIQPGMTATTEILTGRNTVMRYLLKPITKTIDQSLGER